MRRRVGVLAMTVGGALVAVWARRRAPRTVRRAVGRTARTLDRRRRYLAGRMNGWRYRRAWREPAADVPSQVLVDRVRSVLGPLEKRRDLPHVHVTVEGRTVVLHGDVAGEGDASQIVEAVGRVSGVDAVRSHLHVGLTAGDTRPSRGHLQGPSRARRELLEAARDAGCPDAEAAASAVLRVFSSRLPPSERAQLFSHLPDDVRQLAIEPGKRWRRHPRPVRALAAFDSRIAEAGDLPPAKAEAVARRVLTTLHTFVPEEEADISAVLPAELRQMWQETA